MKPWYDNDEFWECFAPKIFPKEQWDNAPMEVEKLVSLLQLKSGACVLDLGCGTGRHSLELARRGFQVVGIDRTAMFLKEARTRAAAEKLKVQFMEADMRTFVSPDKFDAIVNLFTSFGYFEDPEDDRRVLKNVLGSLKPGGKFLLDVIGKEVFARMIPFREHEWIEDNGVFYLQETKPIDNWRRIKGRWIRFKNNEKKEFTITQQLYSGSELFSLLCEAGFKTVNLFGELTGLPYDQTARRLIALAIK
jgi:SAM-dependent methyltransferase